MINEQLIFEQMTGILDDCKFKLSDLKPSEWAQSRMYMKEGNFQGLLSHDITPYWTEILDNLSPYSGFEEIALMAAAQGGKTKVVIEPIVCYYISEHPCNIGYISGNTDLSLESMIDLDKAIENSGIHHLIRPATERVRNSRSGDTNKMKEYPGGNLIGGSATNHKTFRRRNWRLIIADDVEEANDGSEKAGSTVSLIKKRANSYGKSKKIFWCSTPLLIEGSIIYPLYLHGDQRKYHIPCQCCGELIHLEWDIPIEGRDSAGIKWKYDTNDKLKEGSVEYVCQSCGHGFSERNKYRFNKDGLWMPTAETQDPAFASYYWNNLYSAPGMDNWDTLVREYISANPLNQPRKEKEMQTFWNLRMGLPYTRPTQSLKATTIMANGGRYKAGVVPEALSIRDGNGKIVMLTCGADLNGVMAGHRDSKEDDGRLDYEVVAHSESGATYSVYHGSIGTFVPRETSAEKDATDRVKWTYGAAAKNNIWLEFEKILTQHWPLDVEGGGAMRIAACGLDCGYLKDYAYTFIGQSNCYILGLKGEKDDELIKWGVDVGRYKPMHHRNDAYVLQSNMYKDMLSDYMNLKWNKSGDSQPYGFMNFPASEMGLYQYDNYYSHFEAEERKKIEKSDGTIYFGWAKKNFSVQNHLFDCRLYNLAILDIYMKDVCWKQAKLKDPNWADFCNVWKALRMY